MTWASAEHQRALLRAPTRYLAHEWPHLVSELHSDNSDIVTVSGCHEGKTPQPFRLWVLVCVPKALPIGIAAAPAGSGQVVVEENQQAMVCQCFHSLVEDLQWGKPMQRRVGGKTDASIWNPSPVAKHKLQAEGHSHAIEALLHDGGGDCVQWLRIQAVHHHLRLGSPIPIHTSQLHWLPSRIHDMPAPSAQW